jgi:hypothetical protein
VTKGVYRPDRGHCATLGDPLEILIRQDGGAEWGGAEVRRRVLARLDGSGVATALTLGGGWLLTAAPATAATTETFEFTGEAQEFVTRSSSPSPGGWAR